MMELAVVALSGVAVVVGMASALGVVRLALRELPLHVALRRYRIEPSPQALRKAEGRCARCRLRKPCMRGLVRWEDLPPECPNRRLFAQDQRRGSARA